MGEKSTISTPIPAWGTASQTARLEEWGVLARIVKKNMSISLSYNEKIY